MALVGTSAATGQPLLRGAVLVPGVVTRERLNGWHVGIVENFVLLLNDGKGFASSFVLVNASVALGKESGLLDDVLVLVDHVGVASGQTSDVFKELLVGLLMDPRIDDLLRLRLQGSDFLLGKLNILVVTTRLHESVCRAHRARFGHATPRILPISKAGGGSGVLGLLAGSLPLCSSASSGRSGFSYSKRFHLFPCFGGFFEDFTLHLLKHVVDVLEVRYGQFLNRAYKKVSQTTHK